MVDKIGETSQMSGNTYTSFELQNHSFCLDQAIMCVKILHKLVLHGFKDNIDNEKLSHLILNLLQSFNQLITKYNHIINSTDSTIVDFFKEKYAYLIVLYVQVLTDYQDTYPFNFIQTGMSDCLSLIIQVVLQYFYNLTSILIQSPYGYFNLNYLSMRLIIRHCQIHVNYLGLSNLKSQSSNPTCFAMVFGHSSPLSQQAFHLFC